MQKIKMSLCILNTFHWSMHAKNDSPAYFAETIGNIHKMFEIQPLELLERTVNISDIQGNAQ